MRFSKWRPARLAEIMTAVEAVCDFQVIDESPDWIVVDKPAPLVVHPANGKDIEPSLLGGLQQLLACDLAEEGSRLSILTRLDRETSGLVLVAKHKEAARYFSQQFERREIGKEYLAIVHGWPHWDALNCEGRILRAGEVEESAIWLRQRVHPEGRACSTGFRLERRFEHRGRRYGLVRCFPKTGRMHQIRVHLEHLGHPLVGDKIYGDGGAAYLERLSGELSASTKRRLLLPRHALHAVRLIADWRGNSLEWRSGLPADLARFVESG